MENYKTPLTPFQRKMLQRYQSFSDKSPSLGALVILAAPRHLLMAIVFVAAVALCFKIGVSYFGYILIGIPIGAVCRDIGISRTFVLAWPALFQIINWQRLNDLLSDNPPAREA